MRKTFVYSTIDETLTLFLWATVLAYYTIINYISYYVLIYIATITNVTCITNNTVIIYVHYQY